MAAPLKDQFGPDVVERIAESLPVDRTSFVAQCLDGFAELELMDRARHIARVMHTHLDDDPSVAVRQVHDAIGSDRLAGMSAFFYNPHSEFIGRYGLPAYAESMAAMVDLTKVFTAEFCIRPFLEQYPQTMERLHEWASDPNEHVRRLVSEGTRPRLPWGRRLPAFITDPHPVVALLELLKDDPSDYVLRSVGNNLNDISKDHPELAVEIARAWSPGRGPLVRRGLRTLIKAGDPEALAVLGYSASSVSARADLPSEITIGERLPISIALHGHGPVLLDIAVHFVKANGSTSRKVFKGGEVELDGNAVIRRSISFAQHSTRRHYPGPHRVEALINGRAQELGVVLVRQMPGSPA
ncbi:MAG: DNA alkylation repair protein [Actinobacteria bacterium]|nr:DNA alkylation repair protein [Actinomycetota bacterium]